MDSKHNSPAFVMNRLSGSTLHVPDLESVFPHWPKGMSSSRSELETVVNARIDSIYHGKNAKRMARSKGTNLGFFAALWWPNADFERLKTLAFVPLWLFMHDDEIDDPAGEFWEQPEAADKFCLESLEYVQHSLGLTNKLDFQQPENFITRSFDVIGPELRQTYTREQRPRFYEDLEFYMKCTQNEQKFQVNRALPSPEEYRQIRHGTSAVESLVSLNEYASKTEIPEHLVNHPDIKNISAQTSLNISYINHLLSLKEEYAKGVAGSLIPVLYAVYHDLEQATTEALRLIQETVDSLDSSAERILAETASSPIIHAAVEKFVRDSRTMCTGNLHWSLHVDRYGLRSILPNEDGSRDILLRPAAAEKQPSMFTTLVNAVIQFILKIIPSSKEKGRG